MALTVTNVLSVPYRIRGNRKEVVKDCEFDSSYLEKGETLTPATLGFSQFVDSSIATVKAVKGSVNVASAHYEKAKEVLHLYDETPAEVSSEANVEGVVIQVTAVGV